MDTYAQAVAEFLAVADWLTVEDQPMVIALKKAAEELDTNGTQAALLNTFGVTYRTLLKRKQRQADDDPVAALLDEDGGMDS